MYGTHKIYPALSTRCFATQWVCDRSINQVNMFGFIAFLFDLSFSFFIFCCSIFYLSIVYSIFVSISFSFFVSAEEYNSTRSDRQIRFNLYFLFFRFYNLLFHLFCLSFCSMWSWNCFRMWLNVVLCLLSFEPNNSSDDQFISNMDFCWTSLSFSIHLIPSFNFIYSIHYTRCHNRIDLSQAAEMMMNRSRVILCCCLSHSTISNQCPLCHSFS